MLLTLVESSFFVYNMLCEVQTTIFNGGVSYVCSDGMFIEKYIGRVGGVNTWEGYDFGSNTTYISDGLDLTQKLTIDGVVFEMKVDKTTNPTQYTKRTGGNTRSHSGLSPGSVLSYGWPWRSGERVYWLTPFANVDCYFKFEVYKLDGSLEGYSCTANLIEFNGGRVYFNESGLVDGECLDGRKFEVNETSLKAHFRQSPWVPNECFVITPDEPEDVSGYSQLNPVLLINLSLFIIASFMIV